MAYKERKELMKEIEDFRGNRTLISLFNFDRQSFPQVSELGISTQFASDLKGCLYRILKESKTGNGVDIFLYTRGGDTNSVWPIANLVREFDKNFEVIVPFRAHSAGTLFALGAKNIVMTKMSELSPVDPSTGNQFNPIDKVDTKKRLSISVEDVNAYKDFLLQSYGIEETQEPMSLENKNLLKSHLEDLVRELHPLAVGNVYRVHKLIRRLAKELLSFHSSNNADLDKIIKQLTVEPYSHLHMISRKEALKILGKDRITSASAQLEKKVDELLRIYEEDFQLRDSFFLSEFFKKSEKPENNQAGGQEKEANNSSLSKDFRFAGGVVESTKCGYIFITKGTITPFSKIPNNVNVQLPPGQPMPLIPGAPIGYNIEISSQRWQRNKKKEGITL
ncbi:MAG: hypothetical protein AB1724_10000 [Thermodesulfobacteriota bacterium]